MAEGLQLNQTIFKCRKCRNILFNDCIVVNAHGNVVSFRDCNASSTTCSSDEGTVWYIKEDSLPIWLSKSIDEAAWIKGKIICPKCSLRLGSFDFVNGIKCKCRQFILPSIHIVKAKVDIQCQQPITTEDIESKTIENRKSMLTYMNHPGALSYELKQWGRIQPSSVKNEVVDVQKNEMITNKSPRSVDEGSEFNIIADDSVKYLSNSSEIGEGNISSVLTKTIKKCNNSTSLPEQVKDDVICPVCLEVYYEATSCHPCGHIFCDPCLRNLGKKEPTNTACPLCRQLIQQCLPESDLRKNIYIKFPELYKDRKVFEQSSQNQTLPLPWQHGVHFRQQNINEDSESDRQLTIWNSILFLVPDYASNELNFSPSSLIVIISLVMVFIMTLFGGYISIKYILLGFVELSSKEFQYIALTSIQIIAILTIKWYLRTYI